MNSNSKQRQAAVKQAIANEQLEGLNVSRESRAIADRYVVGKASVAEAAAKIRARYGAR